MLTPVTPNPIATSTTIKSHGSESRTASNHNPVEAQPLPQTSSHSSGIGLDAGSILSNVNAEAATAGNRTILQTLALAVATQLNIVRRHDETMEAFFLRIASVLDDMAPDERAALEILTGLKALKIQLPQLSAALKLPDSALAARLSAAAETPLATPQKTAAAAATTSYLQEAPGVSRAAETLAMETQARSNAEPNALFSSSPAISEPEKQPADARSLQSQLKSLFEPGVAETRLEIATKVEQPHTLILGNADDMLEPEVAQPEELKQLIQDEQAIVSEPAVADDQSDAGKTITRNVDPQRLDTKQPEGKQAGASQPDATQPGARQAETRLAEPRPLDTRLTDLRQPDLRQPDLRQSDLRQPDLRQTIGHQAEIRQPEAGQPEQKAALPKPAETVATAVPKPTETMRTEHASEPRMQNLPAPQNNNAPSAVAQLRAIAREIVQERMQTGVDNAALAGKSAARPMQREDGGDHRMQTMLTLRGIAEVITTMPSKAAEFLMSPQLVADIKAKEPRANATLAAPAGQAGDDTNKAQTHSRPPAGEGGHHTPFQMSHHEDEAEDMRGAAHRAETTGASQPARATERETAAALMRTTGSFDAVPFAYAALQPAKEEYAPEALEEHRNHGDDEGEGDDRQHEDEETRRERLAREAVDDLLRAEPEPEPDLKINRDSSQADRAYALYQRMAGF